MSRHDELMRYAEERMADCAENHAKANSPDEKATWLAKHVTWARIISIYKLIGDLRSRLTSSRSKMH